MQGHQMAEHVWNGPYRLENYETGSSITPSRKPINGARKRFTGNLQLLTDTIKELLIRDEASRISALRTGQSI